jgi:UDP-N-acetylmuramoyl-tripeptide--D-alanyl-D-alanine ligase
MDDLRTLPLAALTGGHWAGPPPVRPVMGAAIDTRRLRSGEFFVAIRTERDDGHRYLRDALEKGAEAALVTSADPQIPLPQLVVPDTIAALRAIAVAHRRRFSGEMIAVTGSYGKTTTKNLLALLFGEEETAATPDNLNNGLGVPLSLLGIRLERHRRAIIEVGISHPGEMAELSALVHARHVIFTGISDKHMEFFPSREALLAEKLRIADFVAAQGGRLVCWDDLARRLGSLFPAAHLLPVSKIPSGYPLPTPSRGFARDFALCHTLCRHLGLAREIIEERLSHWRPPPLRGQIFRHRNGRRTYYVDCYNSDFPALLDSVETFLALFPAQRHIFVIGSMGELGIRSQEIHALAGQQLMFSRGDQFYLLGRETEILWNCLRKRGVPEENGRVFTEKTALEKALCTCDGVIYFKGSRHHALETLIDFDNCDLVL